ncbi:hypothetical protein CP557_02180 [Natrinema ejinorense]|uniref:Uncharacterized protein n=2 Tax=Natrinema ejinorense TaxID=373386 RepID=A0A2A5QRH8_9EURY|nr:hypothetical protein CP557_02180 [Natrinema ejinorense]
MVNDALEEMHRRRAEYRRAKAVGAVTKQLQASFQSAVVSVYDELLPHRDRVEETWEDYNLDQVHTLANAKITNQKVDTTGGRIKQISESKPYRIPCQKLLEWSHQFDEIAGELGFSSSVKDRVARNDPDKSDLRGLLRDRGQFEAAEQLPGGDE